MAGSAVRLIADDLTGALDVAAEFTGMGAPVHCYLDLPHGAPEPAAALDLATRERSVGEARAAALAAAGFLRGAAIAFVKIDSLLRGNGLAELAALFGTGEWPTALLAPAFPFQGRTTSGGRQHAGGVPVGPDLLAALRAWQVDAYAFRAGEDLRPGVAVADADSDATLQAVVASVGRQARVLWCGTGGLARALADAPPPAPALERPILGLFGSDHPATQAQLAACGAFWSPIAGGGCAAAAIADRLGRDGVALLSLALPAGVAREHAAREIAAGFARLVRALPRPASLVVAGGETLRGLCRALGAEGLVARGRTVPGLPVSTVVGGAWDGVAVLSKSGAFGRPTLLREVLGLPDTRVP